MSESKNLDDQANQSPLNKEKDEVDKKNNDESETRLMVLYNFGPLADQMSHQAFQFLIFVFYYSVVGINVQAIMWSFVLFTVWDSINDPLLGPISDRTESKLGRRRFWVLVSLVPFSLINWLLFTPPGYGQSDTSNIIYMIIIIMLYDLFYTMFSIQEFAIFPEMFPNKKKRERAATIKAVMTIVGIIIGFVLPTFLIVPLVPTEDSPEEYIRISDMYENTGLLIAILVLIFGYIFFKYGMKEKVKDNSDKIHPKESRSSENSKKNLKEKGDNTKKDSIGVNADNEVEKEREDLENENRKHSILESLKITLTNKNFVIFVLANMFTWFVMKLLTTIVPLYGIHVLGIGDGDLMLSILLMVALLSAAAFAPVMKKLSIKYGTRNAFIISSFIWLVSFIPFGFLDNRPYIALICMIFLGAGLSGAMVFVDIIISDVIDEDYVNTGLNRAGSYYGINALIHRYSTILVFVSISIVLSNYGWAEYIVGPEADFEALRSGLKLLMTVFPVAGLMIVILLLRKFDLHGKKLKNVQAQKREMEKQNQT